MKTQKQSRVATQEEVRNFIKQITLTYVKDTERVLNLEMSEDEEIESYQNYMEKLCFMTVTEVTSTEQTQKFLTVGFFDEEIESIDTCNYVIEKNGEITYLETN